MAIQVRRGASIILDRNQLLPGEFGVTTDTGLLVFCFAPGMTKDLMTKQDMDTLLQTSPEAYAALQTLLADLENNPSELTNILNNISGLQTNKLDKTEKGAVNGLATLNSEGKIPMEQIPEEVSSSTAADTSYDNTESGLAAANVQEALDETNAKINQIKVSVKSFGAVGNANYFNSSDGTWYEDETFTIPAKDDTQAIRDALNASKNVDFHDNRYLINVPNISRESLKWFTDEENIFITGRGACLVDANAYTEPAMTNIFAFTRCENINIKGVNYLGKVITDPDNQLQNLGTTFCYFEDNCKKIEVDANLENMRYGVRSGDYLSPGYGYCKNFKINITGKMIGYPVALYLADDVDIKVDIDGSHRAVYLAGVYGADVNCFTKNSYGATIQVLLTNSLTTHSETQSEQRARGCKRINVKVTDTGSTKYLPYTSLSGIGLQWVAEGTEFSDIDIQFQVRSKDGVASSVAGFFLDSSVAGVPYKFEPYIKFKNIKISGTIDRTDQTVASNQAGEIYIRAYDTADTTFTHCPEVSNFVIDNVVINKGAIQSRQLFFDVPNLKDMLTIRNLQADGIDVISSARTGKVVLQNSKIKALASSSLINDLQIVNSSLTSIDSVRIGRVTTSNIELILTKSANIVRRILVPTTAGTNTYTVAGALKQTSLTKAVVGILSGFIASGNLKIGTAGNLTQFGSAPLNSSSGFTRFSPLHYTQGAFPVYTNSNLVITIDTTTAVPAGLNIELYVYEEEFTVS